MNPWDANFQERNRQQSAIAELRQTALDETNIERFINRAVLLLAEILSVEFSEVLEYTPENVLLLKAGVGWQEGSVGSTRIDPGIETMAGYTLLSSGPVIVENLNTETRFAGSKLLLDHQITSGMSVVIRGSEKPYGILGAYTWSYRVFSPNDIFFFDAVGGILASAVRRSQSEQALQKLAQRLQTQHSIDQAILGSETINQIAGKVVGHIRRLLPCIRASVVIFNHSEGTFSVLASESDQVKPSQIETGPLEQFPADLDFLAQGEIFLYEDIFEMVGQNPVMKNLYSEGVRAFACVPLLTRGELVGSLNFGFGRPGEIQPDRLEVAFEIARTLAIAFQQTILIETDRRRLRQLDALHAIDLAIIGRNDSTPSLDIVVEQVLSSLNIDAAAILLFDPSQKLLKFGAGSGFRTDGICGSQLRLGEGLAGRAALQGKTMSARRLAEAGEEFVRHPLLSGEDFVAYYAVPLIAKDELKGVLDIFHRTPLDPAQEWLDFLHALATQAAIAIDNAKLLVGMQKANRELAQAYDDTIEGWSRALDLRDKETEGHSQRVTELTLRLAKQLGIDESKLPHIRRGALLHDIGKMGIPDHILLKPGALSTEEWEIMKKHPEYAYNLLSPIEYLHPAIEIPFCHHERWDGTGYPRSLKGEEIPLAARIFSIVDVWDALRSDRPYRRAWSREDALGYIQEKAGSQFDSLVVKSFIDMVNGGNG